MRGRKIGVPGYSITAAVWLRGFLKDDFGVAARDIQWFVGGQEEPGGKERIELRLPTEISVRAIPEDKTLNGLLESGEIEGLFAASVRSGSGRRCLGTHLDMDR